MNPKAWETEKQYARDNLPPQFAELVCSTKKPFAQGITDVRSPRNVFMGGKVALIGKLAILRKSIPRDIYITLGCRRVHVGGMLGPVKLFDFLSKPSH